MKKRRFTSRLCLSLLFLALLVSSVLLSFAMAERLVFAGKHSEILAISKSEYNRLIQDIASTRKETGLLNDEEGFTAEQASALDAMVREKMKEIAKADISAFTVQAQNELVSKACEFTADAISPVLFRLKIPLLALGLLAFVFSAFMLARYGEFSRHYLLLFLAIVWLIPIVWLIACAFSLDRGPNISRFWPETWSLNNFRELLSSTDSVAQFPSWFKNSFVIAVFNCVIASTFVLMVAYSMSCMRFGARKPMMNFAIILNLFPGFLTMIAVYFVMKSLSLTNSNIGLILVYSASSGLGYLIAKGFFDTVPKSLREAAKIEGASENVVFWKIVVPLSKPIIVYTVIGAFLSPWMDFIFANIMLNKGISEQKTVAIGLWAMINKVNINDYFGRFCAGGVLVSIPISILFIIMQRFYIEGVTGGSVKG